MRRRENRRDPGRTGSGRGRLLAGLVAVTVATGCGEAPSGQAPGRGGGQGAATGLERPRDGVPRIENPEPTWSRPGRLELVREVGSATVSAEATSDSTGPLFRGIRDVAPADDGRILVLDGSEARVSIIDSSGRVLDRLGGRGPGPGELRTPDRVEADPEGGIIVFERRPAAVHRWRDGEYRGAVALTRNISAETGAEPSSVTELADWGPALSRRRAVRLIRLDMSDPSSSGSAVYAADRAGRIDSPALTWSTPGTRSRLPEVFGARRSWTAGTGPDGGARFAVARGDRYEIRLHDISGDLDAVIRRDVEPRPVTGALRERALEQFVKEAGRAGAPPGMTRELRDQLPVAETLPVIGGLWHSEPDGRLWVGLVGPGAPPGPPSAIRAYDVYESGGRYLGRVTSPPGFDLHRVEGRLLYGSWLDSLGVPGVRVYRLVEPGPSS